MYKRYLEQEEDELSTKVCQVEGGGSASAQAGHLCNHDKSFKNVQKRWEGRKKIAEKFGTSFRSGAWQPGQKPMVNSSSLNIRDFMEGIAGMELFLEVVADPAELFMAETLEPLLEFFKDILPP